MTPGSIGHETDASHGLGKKRVSLHGFRASQFAGIDIGAASISRGVQDKPRFRFTNVIEQNLKASIVDHLAGQRNKATATPSQLRREGLADITGST